MTFGSSTKIVYERLDKVELRINENSKQIKLIEKEIEDIKVSLNFHDQLIEEKSRSVITSQDKCNTINVTQNNESAFSKITNKLREIEDRSRRNNLRIDGIKESEGESWNDNETKVKNIFENYLGLKDIKIERAHRTGHKDSLRPITIIIKLLDFKDKVNILKKGKNIYINEDFCAETLQIRKVLRELMKMERAAGKFASISYDKLIIRDWAAKKIYFTFLKMDDNLRLNSNTECNDDYFIQKNFESEYYSVFESTQFLKSGIIKIDITDHYPIFLVTDNITLSHSVSKSTILIRQINENSLLYFRNLLSEKTDWNLILQSQDANNA
ncbi:uncharacterized protein LOC124813964 [Hydra vulgaris]|uniref:uncharacterized protein LOC124813964 n=1 Tax=Hydra vulgaris TaxID=6087 RepID=UPI0032EA4A8E